MPADALAASGARASAGMVLTPQNWNILSSASEELRPSFLVWAFPPLRWESWHRPILVTGIPMIVTWLLNIKIGTKFHPHNRHPTIGCLLWVLNFNIRELHSTTLNFITKPLQTTKMARSLRLQHNQITQYKYHWIFNDYSWDKARATLKILHDVGETARPVLYSMIWILWLLSDHTHTTRINIWQSRCSNHMISSLDYFYTNTPVWTAHTCTTNWWYNTATQGGWRSPGGLLSCIEHHAPASPYR